MIAVDTNVVAYLFLPGTHTERARKAYLRDHEWCAPLLWRSEFRNVLALYIRKKQINGEAAMDLMREAEALFEAREYQPASSDVLALVERSQCSAYDCEFVAVAKELHVPLVTSDKQVLKAFPQVAVSLEDFVRNV
jgi:predicted nucleic acid-binding protein